MFVYILLCDDGSTYVGATVNLERRIRQHNKELVGGAVATSNKVVKGLMWNMVCYVSGFPDWVSTLQFEWRLKQLTRKINDKSLTPIERRYQADIVDKNFQVTSDMLSKIIDNKNILWFYHV